MGIKEVVERMDKAFPEWEIGSVEKIHTVDPNCSLKTYLGYRISFYEPKKDDKE